MFANGYEAIKTRGLEHRELIFSQGCPTVFHALYFKAVPKRETSLSFSRTTPKTPSVGSYYSTLPFPRGKRKTQPMNTSSSFLFFLFFFSGFGSMQTTTFNHSLEFDGVNDHIKAKAPFSGDEAQYTAEAWFLSKNTDACVGKKYRRIMGFSGYELEIAVCGNELRVYDGARWKATGVNVNDGQWHHVAIVREKPYYRVYLDGAQLLSYKRNNTLNFTRNFIIGGAYSGAETWKGRIAEVRLWNVVRTADEIACGMDQSISGTEFGLKGYWRLNEGPGNNRAIDATLSGNDGVLKKFNAATAWKSGVPPVSNNSALYFDGAGDYIQLTSPLSGDAQEYTAEAWFLSQNTGGCGPYRRIFGFQGYELELAVCGNMLRFYDGKAWINTGVDVNDEQWHHVAAVRKKPYYTLYLDGNEVLNYKRNNTLNFTGTFCIGATYGGWEAWIGWIDEVRLWSRALNQLEIQSAMAQSLTGSEPGLAGYWPMNEGPGATATNDWTGRPNDGILRGFDNEAWGNGFPVCTGPIAINYLEIIPDTICLDTRFEIEFLTPNLDPVDGLKVALQLLKDDGTPIPGASVEHQYSLLYKKGFSIEDLVKQDSFPVKYTCGRKYRLTLDFPDYEMDSYKDIYVDCCDFLPPSPASCENNLIDNPGFQGSNPTNQLPFGKWEAGYGNPTVSVNSSGYVDQGSARLGGNKTAGDAIAANLDPIQLEQGKKYRLRLAVRPVSEEPFNYVKLAAYAFNGTLSATGEHPLPASQIALIGKTGRIKGADWIEVNFRVWEANKDFSKIAVAVFNEEESTRSICYIDNVCIEEVPDFDPCPDVQFDGDGNPILPPYLANYVDNEAPAEEEETETFNGMVHDLYGHIGDTSLDDWFVNWKDTCHTIGGINPPAWDADAFLDSLGIDMTADEVDQFLKSVSPGSPPPPAGLFPIEPVDTANCPPARKNPNKPFAGRDIIFVHGLKLQHVCDKIQGVIGADGEWPTEKHEFYDQLGYYRIMARKTWMAHLHEYLGDAFNPSNRYLLVTYNCSQSMEVAAHSILDQIREAMVNGTNVVHGEDDMRRQHCFGRDAVIISHSTGGPAVDVALSIAKQTQTNAALKDKFGDLYSLQKNIRAHIALAGAFSGSDFASIVIGAGSMGSRLKKYVKYVISDLLESNACSGQFSSDVYPEINSSILFDLVPYVMKTTWQPVIEKTGVPVLLVAGGHPTDNKILKHIIHKGFDDGVLTMGCQCALPEIPIYKYRLPWKVYDMGINSRRARGYHKDQFQSGIPLGQAAGSCLVHLSATGMVQPIKSYTSTSLLFPLAKHYTFLQSASDHFTGPRGVYPVKGADKAYNGIGFRPPKHYYHKKGSVHNREEVRTVRDPAIYQPAADGSQLVNDQYKTMLRSDSKKKSKTYSIKVPKSIKIKVKKWFLPKVKIQIEWRRFSREVILWRRTYVRLQGFENQTALDYVYKYVLTN